MSPVTTQTRAECDRCGAVAVGSTAAGPSLPKGWEMVYMQGPPGCLCVECVADFRVFMAGGEVWAAGAAVPRPGR